MKIKCLSLVVSCCLLFACAKVSDPHLKSSAHSLSPYSAHPVAYYQTMAAQAEDAQIRHAYLLKLSGRLLHEGLMESAQQQLAQIQPATTLQKDEKIILEAQVHLLKKQPKRALALISNVSEIHQHNQAMQAFYRALLAKAYYLSDKPVDGLNQLMALDALSLAKEQHQLVRQQIWQQLSKLPKRTQKTLSPEADETLAGWLELSLLVKKYRTEGQQLMDNIARWQLRYPTHPAQSILSATQEPLLPIPTQVAVMLPLSGPVSGPGQAVRDGFMSAYFASKYKATTVRFYDSYQADVRHLYQQAIDEGADFVIGPLLKAEVETLAKLSLPVATLALNDIGKPISNGMFRFSLDPDNEAAQLALKAFNDGFRRALVISPKGGWGETIAQSFLSRWQQQGGMVADTFYFDSQTDINAGIKQLLHVSDSQARKNALVKTIWKKVTFYPHRRQDFDVIILIAYPSKARQIRPMLKYYYAGNVPVYGTSLLYSGSPDQQHDVDLDEIIFGEMPWVLKHPHQLVKKNWPEQLNSYNRLYALGRDAFLLSRQLNILLRFPLLGLMGNSGMLLMGDNHQIIRQLEWAQFQQGIPKPVI